MKEVRDTGKVVGNERIAIMAALNIAHEQMSNSGKGGAGVDSGAIRRRIVAMQETLDAALAADQENLF
jgi:cell division protein ZapA